MVGDARGSGACQTAAGVGGGLPSSGEGRARLPRLGERRTWRRARDARGLWRSGGGRTPQPRGRRADPQRRGGDGPAAGRGENESLRQGVGCTPDGDGCTPDRAAAGAVRMAWRRLAAPNTEEGGGAGPPVTRGLMAFTGGREAEREAAACSAGSGIHGGSGLGDGRPLRAVSPRGRAYLTAWVCSPSCSRRQWPRAGHRPENQCGAKSPGRRAMTRQGCPRRRCGVRAAQIGEGRLWRSW
jgi:hypothetical protein